MKYSVNAVLAFGLASGKIHIIEQHDAVVKSSTNDYEKLDRAIEKSLDQIAKMKEKSPELVDYLMVQEFMVGDPELKKRIVLMLDEGVPVNMAVNVVMQEFIKGLTNSESSYLKERTNDMEDAARRIILNLSESAVKEPKDPFILYTDKPYPSYLINHKDKILGIISKTGGYTSHTAILCRSYDIPFVTSDLVFNEGDDIIIDTRKKIIITDPSISLKNKIKNDTKNKQRKAIEHSGFKFYANAASALDVVKAMDYGFDGIGLFRTEMIFMNSNRPFTAIEQYRIYCEAVDNLNYYSLIVFRTFDIGGDKEVSYVHSNEKSIDNYKQNPYIFEDQVMALLKIYTDTQKPIRIEFPMIFEPSEFTYLKKWVKQLAQRFDYDVPPIGMMLETKEALESIENFDGVQFISVGTNDLVKSLYNLDRETSVDYIDSYKDDLISRLAKLKKYCDSKHIPIQVCGELASLPDFACELYSVGYRSLSVSPSLVPMLNQAYSEFKDKK